MRTRASPLSIAQAMSDAGTRAVVTGRDGAAACVSQVGGRGTRLLLRTRTTQAARIAHGTETTTAALQKDRLGAGAVGIEPAAFHM